MVKVWGFLPILVALALVVLLAPAVVLLGPPVAHGQTGVLEEMYGTISLNETTSGNYVTFTAGSAELPVCLEQYTRQQVVSNATIPAQFRNLTNMTGTMTGNLSGNLTLRGHGFIFNTTYNYTPVYYAGTRFGHMVGSGKYVGGGGNTFMLMFAYDYDSDDSVSAAVGKGFLFSDNETGTFAGHKLIGEFNLNKSDTWWNGTYFLRNYAPSEVVYQGWINSTGQVNVFDGEFTTSPARCARFNITRFGPFCDVNTGYSGPDFDEFYWGEDNPKTVTPGSFIGGNASIDGSRNGILDAGPTGFISWEGEGELCQWLLINDTYARTGSDGSLHGLIYSLLGVDMPFDTPINWPIEQYGLSFSAFGMPYESTEDYAGTESFGYSVGTITPAISPPYDYSSNSSSYALLPFPRPLTCVPSNGTKGTTMNVTIPGRYFTRSASALNGSLSFGSGITVTAWTVSGTDLNGTIEANITILSNATAGYQTINVTSCFKNQTALRYRSGLLVDGFEVLGTPTSDITGTVYEANMSLIPSATVTLSGPQSKNTTTNASGYYSFTVNTSGTYTINVTKSGFFSPVQKQVNVTLPNPVSCNFTGLDAPYRTAPDGYYCIKCSNEWLFGGWYPAGFALNATRVSDILYAWTHPS